MLKDFILWQKAEDLVEYLFPIVDRFPKHEKFALCSEIKNLCYDMMKGIIRTNKMRNKTQGIYELDTQIEMLRWFVRHSHKRRYLADRSYETTAKKVDEIGRIIGGLIKGGV
ncbi:hypothetical protein FACS189447_03490 [Spirochaetia bacterium]|nr:hypothetical protein FACS189447_03490 [Spirochaetia bacterium]